MDCNIVVKVQQKKTDDLKLYQVKQIAVAPEVMDILPDARCVDWPI